MAELKSELRRHARALRDGLPSDGSEALADRLLAYLAGIMPQVAGGFWPIGSEIDPRPAMMRLAQHGAQLALPETTERGTALRFRLWQPGELLHPGRFGTVHPDGPETIPDLLLVPLLAFDRRCHRLGYGGGYYDRTLAAWPGVRAIGCAYAAQQRDELPEGPYDIALHAVVTERGVIER